MAILFKTDIDSEADLKVFVTNMRFEADVIICETPNRWAAAKSCVWYYTDIRSEAEKIVYFTANQWDADLIVFKTDVLSDAGWVASAKSDLLDRS